MGMDRRTFVGRERIRIAEQEEPVPMQDRDVLGRTGAGMPAQQMVVIRADLTGAVVVADIMKIGDGQRSMAKPEDQWDDPEKSNPNSPCRSAGRHAGVTSPPNSKKPSTSMPHPEPVFNTGAKTVLAGLVVFPVGSRCVVMFVFQECLQREGAVVFFVVRGVDEGDGPAPT